jgi:cytochrome c biogenesis protein ResB
MNHPVKHAAYTFYQTGYRQQPGGKDISFLNVSWDPGQPVVFAGYITVMVGMVIVLGTRISEYRRRTATLAGGRIREAGDDSKDGGA